MAVDFPIYGGSFVPMPQVFTSVSYVALLRGRHCKVEEHIDAWEACVVYFRRPLKNTADAGGSAAGTPFMSGFG